MLSEHKLTIRMAKIKDRLNFKQYSTLQKMLIMLLWCFIGITISSYISWLMGSQYFFLNFVKVQESSLTHFVAFILFSVNNFICFSIVLNEFSNKSLHYTIFYAPIYLTLEILFKEPNLIKSTLAPLLFIIVISILRKDFLKTIIRYILLTVPMVIYQGISLFIKTNIISSGYNDLSLFHYIYSCVDFFLFLTVIYMIRGVKNGMGWKLVAFPQSKQDSSYDADDLAEIAKVNALPFWQKAKVLVLVFAFQLLQLISVLAICKIGNVFAEVLIILPVFWLFRSILERCWHSESLIACTLSSMVIFYVGSKITIPLHLSMFMPIIVGAIIAYSLYRIAIHFEEFNENKKFIDNANSFDPNKATEGELRFRCRKCEFSEADEELVVSIFLKRKTLKEIAFERNSDETAIRKLKSRLKQRLIQNYFSI